MKNDRQCGNFREQLKRELKRLHALTDGIDEVIYVADPKTYKLLFVNKKTKELCGSNVVGKKCYKVFQNLNRPCPFCTNKHIFGLHLGKSYVWESQNLKNKRWYRCIDKAIKWPGRKHVRFEIAIDITDHKKMAETLHETNTKLQTLIEAVPDILYFKDAKGRNLIVNKTFEKLAGLPKKKIVGKTDKEVLPKELAAQCKKSDNEVLKKKKSLRFEEEIVGKDGEKVFFETIKTPLRNGSGNIVGVVGVSRDNTERKKAERALAQSEERFRQVAENAQEWIWEVDTIGLYTYASPIVKKILGYEPEEIVGKKHFYDLFHPEDKEELKKTAFEVFAQKKPFVSFINRNVHKNGNTVWLSTSAVPIVNKNGELLGYRGADTDITERKNVEKTLRESEELFHNIVENSHTPILIINDKFQIAYANDQATRLSGYSKSEIIGKDFRKFLDKESKVLIEDRYVRRQNGEDVPPTYEFKVIRKNGEIRDVEIRSAVLRDRHGRNRTLAQVLDITERKKMEDIRKSFEERLSALNTYGQSLNSAKNMDEICKLTLDAMEKTLGFEYASFFALERKILRLMGHRKYPAKLEVSLPIDGEKGVTVKAARTGKPVYVSDIRKEKTYINGGVKGMLSELAVPIKAENMALGVLNVESKRVSAFSREDKELLEILASHASTAISNLKKQEALKIISEKLTNLMKSSTEIMHSKQMHKRLKVIAKTIQNFGWRRVVISLRDENLEGTDLVATGLTKEEVKLLLERKAPGHIWKERLGLKFERFKIGEFYYLPWLDPWIRENVHLVPRGTAPDEATTYAGVPSRLSTDEMVDWHPQDMLYAPLRTPEGRIVGILSMDDPVDGRRPDRELLAPLELFLHQAAITIENAQLIESLREARKQLGAYAEQLEQKVEERTRELKESQERCLRSQRLAVIGELAGMVGHDLRNPLTSIAGATYYAKKHLGSNVDDKTKEMLDLIDKNISYSNKIINDLLDYSREIALELRRKTPKSLITDTLLHVEIPKNVKIVNSAAEKPTIRIDIEKTKRAIVNIIKNALDAMPKGGVLNINSRKRGDRLELVFSDTGVGMTEETLAKLWTPLFTTKAKGMGFGLPICKRIIEAHGGHIHVESKVKEGTTFTVSFPIEPEIDKGGEKIWVKTLESSLLTTTKT